MIAIGDGGFTWWVGVLVSVVYIWRRTRSAQVLRGPVLAGVMAGVVAWVVAGGGSLCCCARRRLCQISRWRRWMNILFILRRLQGAPSCSTFGPVGQVRRSGVLEKWVSVW